MILNLAWQFRRWDVEEWLSEISEDELLEWIEFVNIEPVLPVANSLHFGILGSTIANSIPNFSKRRKKAVRPTDLYPWVDQNWQPNDDAVLPTDTSSNDLTTTTTTNMSSYLRFKSQIRKYSNHKHVIVN